MRYDQIPLVCTSPIPDNTHRPVLPAGTWHDLRAPVVMICHVPHITCHAAYQVSSPKHARPDCACSSAKHASLCHCWTALVRGGSAGIRESADTAAPAGSCCAAARWRLCPHLPPSVPMQAPCPALRGCQHPKTFCGWPKQSSLAPPRHQGCLKCKRPAAR